MKISILTPSYNQGEYIEQTIQSVLNQNHEDFEHVIIDGGSTDNTVNVLKKYSHLIWVSEPDKGQSDALNKGLEMASGEIIGWINSDDYYVPNIFADVAFHFLNPHVQWIIGRTSKFYESLNMVVENKYSLIDRLSIKKNCDYLRTPAAFYRKSLLQQVGGFNTKFKYAMDYDLFVKLSNVCDPKNVNILYTGFRVHNKQKTNIKNIAKQFFEIREIMLQDKNFVGLFNKMIKVLNYSTRIYLKILLSKLNILNKDYQDIPLSVHKMKSFKHEKNDLQKKQ